MSIREERALMNAIYKKYGHLKNYELVKYLNDYTDEEKEVIVKSFSSPQNKMVTDSYNKER